MFLTLIQALFNHGYNNPDKTAIIFKDTKITYSELASKVENAAHVLSCKYGVKKSDIVLISAVSKPEYIIALIATQNLGAVTVPVDKAALKENIIYDYHYVGGKLLLSDTKIDEEGIFRVGLTELCSEKCDCADDIEYSVPDGSTIIEMLLTTGTTGKPKVAMLSGKAVNAIINNTVRGIGMNENDVVLLPLPLNHSVGMRVLRSVLCIGATLVIQNGFMITKDLKNNIAQHHCTALVSVPASLEILYRNMGEEFADTLRSLRYIEVGAGALSIQMRRILPKILPDTEIFNTWGSTETGGAIFLNISKDINKTTSLGKPVNDISVIAIDEAGNDISKSARDTGTAGRMALFGDMVMSGYYNMPEQTKLSLVDGWLVTNDLIYFDEDGFIYMVGRADDIINVGGKKVSPVEIENIAIEFPEVTDAGCIGAEDPDGLLGQVPMLFVSTTDKYIEKDFLRFLISKTEYGKMPKKVIRLDCIPRNALKKLDRNALREIYKNIAAE